MQCVVRAHATTPSLTHARYYNDLWELDLAELKWAAVGNLATGPWPSPRSGCQLALHADTLFVYGGYSKVGACACVHTT